MIKIPESAEAFDETLKQTLFELPVKLLISLEVAGSQLGVDLFDHFEVPLVLDH
jgi:hypothetical protein